MMQLTPKQIIKMIIVALLVIAIGMFIINQTMDYFFKMQLLQEPCALCVEKGYHCAKVAQGSIIGVFNFTPK